MDWRVKPVVCAADAHNRRQLPLLAGRARYVRGWRTYPLPVAAARASAYFTTTLTFLFVDSYLSPRCFLTLALSFSQSDVDMVVEMPEGHYLGYRLFDLRRELKQALGRRLDLHTPPNAHTNGSVARAIEKTKVLVYSA